MQYKLGDFVRFVDEKLEGYVTRIIDEQMIGVTVDDGFELPVLAAKVTSVHGHEQSQKTNATIKEAEIPAGEFITKGIYVAVVNDQKTGSVVHFHLVNDTSFQLLVTLSIDKQHQHKGEYAGIIAPKTTIQVYSEQLADLQLWPKFKWQVLYYTKQNIDTPAPLIINEKYKAKDFAGAKKEVPLLKQQGWLIQLDEPELVIDAQKLKESFFKPSEEKNTVTKPKQEVDLHIEKLRDDHQFLNSSEMLDIQLKHFRDALDAAIVHHFPEIVFIHGVGNGTLKHELHKALSKNSKVQTFMDAHKEKFGYGATKVLLK